MSPILLLFKLFPLKISVSFITGLIKLPLGGKTFHFLSKQQQWKVWKPQIQMLVQGPTSSNILWAIVLISIYLEHGQSSEMLHSNLRGRSLIPFREASREHFIVLCIFQTLMKHWNMGEVISIQISQWYYWDYTILPEGKRWHWKK